LLLEPAYGNLSYDEPDGNPQVNPMWFDWDGELMRFTHTFKTAEDRQLTANRTWRANSSDPETCTATEGLRGVVEEIVRRYPSAAVDMHLTHRYSGPLQSRPAGQGDPR